MEHFRQWSGEDWRRWVNSLSDSECHVGYSRLEWHQWIVAMEFNSLQIARMKEDSRYHERPQNPPSSSSDQMEPPPLEPPMVDMSLVGDKSKDKSMFRNYMRSCLRQ